MRITTFSIKTLNIMTFSSVTLTIRMNKKDIHHNDTQRNAKHCYAKCCLCSESFMLSVTFKPFMLSVIKLNIIMQGVITPSASCLSVASVINVLVNIDSI